MNFKFAIAIMVASLASAGGADAQGQAAPEAGTASLPPPCLPLRASSSGPAPKRDQSRLPLPGDTGFAWDKLNHRGAVRWECRATPSGQFVRQSFCELLPRVEGHRPEAFKDTESWDGMVHAD